MPLKNEYLSLSDISKLLGLPEVTIQRWEHQGKIPYKVINKQIVFKRKEIIEWANAHDLHVIEEKQKVKSNLFSISDIIKNSGIYYNITGNDVYSVFENALAQLTYIKSSKKGKVLDELINREEMASTGIGNGIAIPHTRSRLDLGLKQPFIPVFFTENSIQYNAPDKQPVNVLFMIFSNSVKEHLKILSGLSYILRQSEVVKNLEGRNINNDLVELIKRAEDVTHGSK